MFAAVKLNQRIRVRLIIHTEGEGCPAGLGVLGHIKNEPLPLHGRSRPQQYPLDGAVAPCQPHLWPITAHPTQVEGHTGRLGVAREEVERGRLHSSAIQRLQIKLQVAHAPIAVAARFYLQCVVTAIVNPRVLPTARKRIAQGSEYERAKLHWGRWGGRGCRGGWQRLWGGRGEWGGCGHTIGAGNFEGDFGRVNAHLAAENIHLLIGSRFVIE